MSRPLRKRGWPRWCRARPSARWLPFWPPNRSTRGEPCRTVPDQCQPVPSTTGPTPNLALTASSSTNEDAFAPVQADDPLAPDTALAEVLVRGADRRLREAVVVAQDGSPRRRAHVIGLTVRIIGQTRSPIDGGPPQRGGTGSGDPPAPRRSFCGWEPTSRCATTRSRGRCRHRHVRHAVLQHPEQRAERTALVAHLLAHRCPVRRHAEIVAEQLVRAVHQVGLVSGPPPARLGPSRITRGHGIIASHRPHRARLRYRRKTRPASRGSVDEPRRSLS